MINNLKKLFTIADVLLIFCLIILSSIMLIAVKKDITAKTIKINYQNELVYARSLEKDDIVEIDEGIIVEIINGKVRIKESTCKHHYCVKQGWSDNFPIVCLPNKLSVIIDDKNDEMLMTR